MLMQSSGPAATTGAYMKQTKIAVFVGSLRKESFNRCLARAVEKLAPAEFTFEFVQIDDLPLYSQDMDADYPPVCRRLKKDVESADAVLFVTPEYNRSIPWPTWTFRRWASRKSSSISQKT